MCIGSASKDIFFPLDGVRILNTPEDLASKKNMVLELGAKYRTENRYEALGGCSLNVSVALARLGLRPFSYSVVGGDAYGEEIIREIDREGVSTKYMTREKGVGTDVSCILVDTKSADRTIVYNRDANERLCLQERNFKKSNSIFVSGLYGKWKENLSVIEKMARKKRVFYNPGQKNITEDVRRVLRVVAVSEIVFLNKDEAIEIVSRMNKKKNERCFDQEEYLAQRIAERGARCVVITDGKRGAWVYTGKECYFAKAKRVENAIDGTGAGDAFTGAFLAGYAKGKDMAECLRWGIVNGASVVQYYGATEGLLTVSEITTRSKGVRVRVV